MNRFLVLLLVKTMIQPTANWYKAFMLTVCIRGFFLRSSNSNEVMCLCVAPVNLSEINSQEQKPKPKLHHQQKKLTRETSWCSLHALIDRKSLGRSRNTTVNSNKDANKIKTSEDLKLLEDVGHGGYQLVCNKHLKIRRVYLGTRAK